MFERKCRGGVSGGSGEDHVGSNAKAARKGRRRRIQMQATFIMGAAYRRDRRQGQGKPPRDARPRYPHSRAASIRRDTIHRT
jgi:hypothetical protein